MKETNTKFTLPHINLSITGSLAGLSRVDGVRRSSAETRNFNPSPKAPFSINSFQIWRGWLRYGGHQPWQSWFWSDERSRRHVGATYTGTVAFFIFFNRATAHTREQFSRTIAPKTRSVVRKTLLGWEMCNSDIDHLRLLLIYWPREEDWLSWPE